jgi:phospholipid/cholesterol/gamma-HCH transport system permease protein
MNALSQLGWATRRWLANIGHAASLLFRLLALVGENIRRFSLVRDQIHFLGNYSLAIIAVSGLFVGFVLSLQGYYTLQRFGAADALGLLVTLSLVRELGPVVTALLFAGRAGTSLTAEIGLMKAGEQIDAMEVSGTNPFKYLVVTRVMAATVMVPILSSVAIAIALFGAYLGVNIRGNVSWDLFWFQSYDALSYGDFIPALMKTFFFGFAIGIIGCYKGFTSQKGTEGVGRSATTAVIVASLLVFILDLIAVQVTDLLGLT